MPIEVSVTDQNVQVSTSGQTVNASVSGGVGPAGPAGASAWGDITGKPTTFSPSSHAASHAAGGSDPITVGTTADRIVVTTTGGKLTAVSRLNTFQVHDDSGTQLSSIDLLIADAGSFGLDAAVTLHVTKGTTSETVCAGNDARLSDARTPTGAAGGDLTGTYPNPTIAAGAVVTADLADGAVTDAKVTSVDAAKVTSGTIATARLGSGTASPLSFLAGNQTWRTFSFIPGFSGLADADDWASRVVANGGAVSGDTMDAVYRLCMQFSSSGLRQRFFRVGIFAGTGLNAALVPLYRGPSLSGTQYGNATDTNVGPFVSGDYAESSGLTGNGSSKYLDTGFPMNTLPSTTSGHAAVYCRNRSSSSAFCGMVGVNLAGGTGFGVATDATVYAQWGAFANTSNNVNGLLVSSRTSATSLVAYAAGVAIATTITSTTPTASTLNATVFVSRNSASSHTFFDARTYGFYSIGTGLSALEVSALTTAVNVFQSTLGRDA